jgi:hypothetical protein
LKKYNRIWDKHRDKIIFNSSVKDKVFVFISCLFDGGKNKKYIKIFYPSYILLSNLYILKNN